MQGGLESVLALVTSVTHMKWRESTGTLSHPAHQSPRDDSPFPPTRRGNARESALEGDWWRWRQVTDHRIHVLSRLCGGRSCLHLQSNTFEFHSGGSIFDLTGYRQRWSFHRGTQVLDCWLTTGRGWKNQSSTTWPSFTGCQVVYGRLVTSFILCIQLWLVLLLCHLFLWVTTRARLVFEDSRGWPKGRDREGGTFRGLISTS